MIKHATYILLVMEEVIVLFYINTIYFEDAIGFLIFYLLFPIDLIGNNFNF